MIPSQQKLVEDLAGKPFALIGINSDKEDRSVLRKKFKKERISWPQVMDGADDKITKRWNVRWYPTIYVVDHKGVIRHRDLSEEQLVAVLADLVGKAEKDRATPKTPG